MGKEIVIIGGGPAGIEAALAAARADENVKLICDSPVGGRSGWHSLLPSKVWLNAVAKLDSVGKSPETADVSHIVKRIKQVKQSWHENTVNELQQAGVRFVQGTASFVDEHQLRVVNGDDAETIGAEAFIVATGSVPIFPPALKPDGKRVIAPRFASHLNQLPQRMIVIGAGATGCETAYLFNSFGVQVTWIVDQFGILPNMHPDLGLALGHALVQQGVQIVQGQMVDRLKRDEDGVTAVLNDGTCYKAEMAFVAIGRKPDWGRVDLGAAGLWPDENGRYLTNEFCQTAVSHIYLVGDADGGWMIANKAMAQGRAAGRHASGLAGGGYNGNTVVQVAYTEPEVAQVGNINSEEGVLSVRLPFKSILKAQIIGDEYGFVEIFYNEADRSLQGATAIGPHASSVLSPVALALSVRVSIDDLANVFAAHPTLDELLFAAARRA